MTWLGSPWDSDLTIKSGACWVARQNRQVAPRSIIKHIDYYVTQSAKHRVESGLMDVLPAVEMSFIASRSLDCTFFICTSGQDWIVQGRNGCRVAVSVWSAVTWNQWWMDLLLLSMTIPSTNNLYAIVVVGYVLFVGTKAKYYISIFLKWLCTTLNPFWNISRERQVWFGKKNFYFSSYRDITKVLIISSYKMLQAVLRPFPFILLLIS